MIDTFSETWWTVRDWANAEIARLSLLLETSGTDISVTENHRGRIATLRGVIALAEPKTVGLEDSPVIY